jgi:high affinity Mn2+ porin
MKRFLPWLGFFACAWNGAAAAADAPLVKKAAPDYAAQPASRAQQYDWTGFYVGGHFGYGAGTFGSNTNPVISKALVAPNSLTGFVGGYQVGYNVHWSQHVVLGFEADLSFTSPPNRPYAGILPYTTTFNVIGTARPRIGYEIGGFLPYVTGGLAWGQTRVDVYNQLGDIAASTPLTHLGWTVGAGIEAPLTGNWTAKLEYNYIDLGAKTTLLQGTVRPDLTVDPHIHVVKAGLNYRLWTPPPEGSGLPIKAPAAAKALLPDSEEWSIHGQTTFLPQGYGRFRSPYAGDNSLPGGGMIRETWTTTAYIGRRLWEGGEVYFNPELAQGFGLAGTLGLGGFSNGEAQKAGAPFPKIRALRYFLRQTFGFGGGQETLEDGPNQLAGKRDVDRLTVTVGQFAVGDFFDANVYAHDPRMDFMNWALWSAGAYDFPANLPGYTRGAVAELNRKAWALRAGVFEVPEQPNSDILTTKTGGAVVELETRHSISGQPGKLRFGVFANRGNTGNYRQAVAIAAADPTVDINDAMAANRQQRSKRGVYANVEQAITPDVGVFARASWNDGRNEILSFTDIDRSLSGGASIGGRSWGRPNDRVGLGGAINGLSGPHRDFLAAGGLGLLIGDGRLNYQTERIFEAYYAWKVWNAVNLTFDYQFVANPAYNADRGPASIFGARLHAEF